MEALKQNISLEALKVAISQLGQIEEPKGSNKGPMVNEYLKSVGLDPGYAWCQAFVYWCYLQAAKAAGIECPVVRSAGVKDCWSRTATNKKIFILMALAKHDLVAPGDQVILLFKNGGHTCLVEKIEGDVIHTIEGNSNTDGSREGYEVTRHQRHFNDAAIAGFIKYS